MTHENEDISPLDFAARISARRNRLTPQDLIVVEAIMNAAERLADALEVNPTGKFSLELLETLLNEIEKLCGLNQWVQQFRERVRKIRSALVEAQEPAPKPKPFSGT